MTFLLVDYPFVIVDDVLVGVLASRKVQGSEPLISVVVELHLVTLLPVVKRAANMHALMSWSPVVKSERVRCTFLMDAIEFRLDDSAIVRLTTSLGANICIVKLIEIAFLAADDLVEDVHRDIHLGVPLCEKGLSRKHFFVIDVDLVTQTTELLKPSDADFLTRHSSIESVLTQLCVLLLIPEGTNRSLNGEYEVLFFIALKSVSRADLTVPLIFNNRVFEAACLEGNNWGASDEELMLHNTTRLKKTRHKAKVSATVDQSSVSEEFFRSCPKAVRVPLLQVPHAVGTLG